MLADDQEDPRLVHPDVATVTYLTGEGAPTLILDQVPIPTPGMNGKGKAYHIKRGFLSQPAAGKHVAFNGNLLHGVPPEMMLKPTKMKGENKRERQKDAAATLRLTFLVNMWWGGKPTGIRAFPVTALVKQRLQTPHAQTLIPRCVIYGVCAACTYAIVRALWCRHSYACAWRQRALRITMHHVSWCASC